MLLYTVRKRVQESESRGEKGDLRVISCAVREWTPGEGTEKC